MPNTTITDLVSASNAIGATIPADQAGSTVKLTPEQIVTQGVSAGVADRPPTIVVESDTSFPTSAHPDRSIIRCTAGSAVTVAVPEQDPGTMTTLVQEGTGQITLDPDSTTLLFDDVTFSPATAAQGSSVVLFWLTASIVLVVGDLELV